MPSRNYSLLYEKHSVFCWKQAMAIEILTVCFSCERVGDSSLEIVAFRNNV